MREIAIYNSCKKGRIVMTYHNGCVNTVVPYDLIHNKSNASKTSRTEGKRYSNGYNIKGILVDFNCIPEDYFLVFQSRDTKNNLLYTKAHKVSDIAIHGGLQAEGNVLINPRIKGELLDVHILPGFVAHLITGLTFTKNQTSSTLGIKEGEKDYRNVTQTLSHLIRKFSGIWKNK